MRTTQSICAALLLLTALSVHAEEPALARLSFWVPPERMAEFGAAYEKQVAPSLAKHGLAASPERGRATVDSAFSRLFALAALDTFFSTTSSTCRVSKRDGWR